MNLAPRRREALAEALRKDPRVVAAYLLGSVRGAHFRPDSDIDLAILPAPGVEMPLAERLALAAALSTEVGRDVDIGLLGTRDLVYAKEAIVTGECVFCRNAFQRDLFAATALSLYLQLKHQRREVEDAYRAR